MDCKQQLSFIGLVSLNTILATKQYRHQALPLSNPSTATPPLEKTDHPAVHAFEWKLYLVYLFAVPADWMQGPPHLRHLQIRRKSPRMHRRRPLC
jgi:hypothetical protein